MTSNISRRALLGAGAAGVGASLLPLSLQQALASTPQPGGLAAIKHVVLLMQENRSFDHYYGTLRGVRGFGDRNALRLPGGGSVYEQPNGTGTVLPFSVREAAAAAGKDVQYIGDLDHSWAGGHRALRQGWSDNWIAAKSPATMAFYDRTDLAFQYELAETFTICDAYHCSVPTSTSPNRNYFVSGYTGYEPDGVRRAIGNDAYAEDTHGGYSWKTYAERLEAAGKSWKVYQEWDNFQDNNLEFYVRFKQLARKVLAPVGDFKSMDRFYAAVFDASEADRAVLLDKLAGSVAQLGASERRLYSRGLARVSPLQLGAAFRADVESGTLPAVSYIVPSAIDSEHPGASSPLHSANITYQILDALASTPEVWASTAVFLTFDENDGFFDHMPPPRPPLDVTDEYYLGDPIGFGNRVPMTVVSPWTVGGYVCSQLFEHSSMSRFLERWLGVPASDISRWRRQVSGDLTSAFDFGRGQPAPDLPPAAPPTPFTGRWRPAPPAVQSLPSQEPGSRRARPLPYQPDAFGRFLPGGRQVRVTLTNEGPSSVHYALYPYAGEYAVPQHVDVKAKLTQRVPVVGDRYSFTVIGPNGFRREFAGAAAAEVAEVSSLISARPRRVRLELTNHGDEALTFLLTPYGGGDPRRVVVRPEATRAVRWEAEDEHGWYDFTVTVTVAGQPGFVRRLAGHIENGRESVSG